MDDAIEQITEFLELPKAYIEQTLHSLIEKDDFSVCKYGGVRNIFPPNIIIKAEDAFIDSVQYAPDQFVYQDLDFNREKFFQSPLGMIFMINNHCSTDCVYCYADKSVRVQTLPFERIQAIIQNARQAGVLDVLVTGGEICLYPQWKELINELVNQGYKPPIFSTKVPLKEADIDFIKGHKIPVQISLDSIQNECLKKILNVNDHYLEQIKHTLLLLEQKNVQFQVATIITQYNDDLEMLEEMHEFLRDFKNIVRWEIRVAFKSLYSRADFDTIKISRETENRIARWIDQKKETTPLNIQWSPSGGDLRYFKCEGGSRHFAGSRCSANYSHMVILPDGKVSICEQLYWNPRFLIGDVSKQSIEEVWNSPRALELAFPKKENFRDASVCKKCSIFDECFAYPNKCFADVLKGYGDENWDFPDPRCKCAPEFIYELNPE
ncbi:MAG: radical SAM protein [Dysgonamonadaceae bacterium]|nr:radical SAM protein [Dysgonamonadaceae bacterium]